MDSQEIERVQRRLQAVRKMFRELPAAERQNVTTKTGARLETEHRYLEQLLKGNLPDDEPCQMFCSCGYKG